jgi:hypothetical protein
MFKSHFKKSYLGVIGKIWSRCLCTILFLMILKTSLLVNQNWYFKLLFDKLIKIFISYILHFCLYAEKTAFKHTQSTVL